MSLFVVLRRLGTLALLRLLAALLLFMVLHLARIPLVLAARVLETAMRRLDGYAAGQAARMPDRPINHFFTPREAPGVPVA
jgi:hypothetical protein